MKRIYEIKEIEETEMAEFVARPQHHYSAVMPKTTKIRYGGFRDGVLVAAISFGGGTRPADTLPRIFPSLSTTAYLEIGKMCLHPDEPQDSGSQFISQAFDRLKSDRPDVKLIFTWADGLFGKHGGVYQAASLYYGEFERTEGYRMPDGKCIRPLQLQSWRRQMGLKIKGRTQRPSMKELLDWGWRHYKGRLFRYVRFLCGKVERRRLLRESPFPWTLDRERYPKEADLEWRQRVRHGEWEPCFQPEFDGVWKRDTARYPKRAANEHREKKSATTKEQSA